MAPLASLTTLMSPSLVPGCIRVCGSHTCSQRGGCMAGWGAFRRTARSNSQPDTCACNKCIQVTAMCS